MTQANFNSYGSRRGNHEVMMRGTFANIRIRNEMLKNVEGGMTKHPPDGEEMPIFVQLHRCDARGHQGPRQDGGLHATQAWLRRKFG